MNGASTTRESLERHWQGDEEASRRPYPESAPSSRRVPLSPATFSRAQHVHVTQHTAFVSHYPPSARQSVSTHVPSYLLPLYYFYLYTHVLACRVRVTNATEHAMRTFNVNNVYSSSRHETMDATRVAFWLCQKIFTAKISQQIVRNESLYLYNNKIKIYLIIKIYLYNNLYNNPYIFLYYIYTFLYIYIFLYYIYIFNILTTLYNLYFFPYS